MEDKINYFLFRHTPEIVWVSVDANDTFLSTIISIT